MLRKVVLNSTLVISLSLVCPASYSLEPGYYAHGDRSFDEILRLKEKSDEQLYCFEPDKMLVHSCPRQDGRTNWLKREDVSACIKGVKHKNLLVVWFKNYGPTVAKFVPSSIEKIKQAIHDMEPFIHDLGFARVVIITGSSNSVSNGYYVFSDKRSYSKTRPTL